MPAPLLELLLLPPELELLELELLPPELELLELELLPPELELLELLPPLELELLLPPLELLLLLLPPELELLLPPELELLELELLELELLLLAPELELLVLLPPSVPLLLPPELELLELSSPVLPLPSALAESPLSTPESFCEESPEDELHATSEFNAQKSAIGDSKMPAMRGPRCRMVRPRRASDPMELDMNSDAITCASPTDKNRPRRPSRAFSAATPAGARARVATPS